MYKENSIKKNILMNVILTGSNFLFPMITYVYVVRKLLPSGMGKIAFVQSILAYFTYIAMLGVQAYGTRECAKVRDNPKELSTTVQELLCINAISTVAAYVALGISILIIPKFRTYGMLFLILGSGILLQAMGLEWLYIALEKYTYITVRSISFKLISVVLIFIFIDGPEDYLAYAGILLFSTYFPYLFNFFHSRKYISYKKIDGYDFKKHLTPIFTFFMAAVFINIYGHCDTVMLGFMKNDSDVGLYGSAMKIRQLVLSVSTAITSVLIPRMTVYLAKNEYIKFNDMVVKSAQVTLVLMFPICIFVSLNAWDLLKLLAGDQFLPAAPTLFLFMINAIILSITNLFGNQILNPKGQEARYSKSVFWGMFINISLNAVLIPRYSYLGAAIATCITELFNAFYMGIGCKEEIIYAIHHIKARNYFLPIVFAIILEVITAHLGRHLWMLFRLVINSLVFFGTYYILQIIMEEPIVTSVMDYLKIFLARLKATHKL